MARVKRYPIAPDSERFDRARAAHAVERREEYGVTYERITSDYRGQPRGALRVGERIVPAYPSIGRIFALASGIRQLFDAEFFAEEKIDGYNVRIFSVGDRIVPVTRSGKICPFTLDRLPDLLDLDALRRLFAAQPDLVVCAEVAGRGNPYMPTHSDRWGADVSLYGFDLMRCNSQRFVPLEERRQLLAAHGVSQPPLLGRFSPGDPTPLAQEVLRLDREGGEGVVLKPPEQGTRVKYVTPTINLVDIATDAALELELPGEFFTHRIVRMVMALRELEQGERLESLARELGWALAHGFDEAVQEVARHGRLSRLVRVRLRSQASCDALLDHLAEGSRTIAVEEVERRPANGYYELTFRKVFRKSSDKLKTLLAGGTQFD